MHRMYKAVVLFALAVSAPMLASWAAHDCPLVNECWTIGSPDPAKVSAGIPHNQINGPAILSGVLLTIVSVIGGIYQMVWYHEEN